MGQFFALASADMRTFMRSRVAVFWTFAFPMLILVTYMQLFASPRLGEVALIIDDRDRSVASVDFTKSVVAVMRSQDAISVKVAAATPARRKERRELLVRVPAAFGETAAAGRSARVRVAAGDASDPAVAAALGILRGAVTTWNMAAAGEVARAVVSVAPDVEVRSVDARRADYLVAGLIVMVALSSALMGFAVPLVANREYGMTRQQSLWPVGRGTILAAWASSKLVIILTSALALCVVAAILYDFGRGLSVGGVLVGCVIVLTATSCLLALGLAIASRSKSTQAALVVANALYFVGLFTGDLLIPTGGLPEALRNVLAFSPVNAFAQALRSALEAPDFATAFNGDIWSALLVFSVLGTGAFLFARKTYRWSAR